MYLFSVVIHLWRSSEKSMPWSVRDWLKGLFHNFEDMFGESLKVIVRKPNI